MVVLTWLGAIPAQADRVASARLAADIAERHYWDACRAVDQARWAVNAAANDQGLAADRVRNADVALADLQSILNDAAVIEQAAGEALAAAKHEAELAQTLAAAQARLQRAEANADNIRLTAKMQFEASPAYQQSTQAIEIAQNNLDAVTRASLARLELDEQFARLQFQATTARDHLRRLRDQPQPDSQELAKASQAWMDAESAVGTYRNNWLAADQAVVAGNNALLAGQNARQELMARLERDLSNDPALQTAVAARETEAAAAAGLSEELNATRSARQAAEQRRAELEARVANAQQQYAAYASELDAASADLNRASNNIAFAEAALRSAEDNQARASWYRDAAIRDLHIAIAERDRFHHDDHDDHDHHDDRGGGASDRERAARDRDRDREQRLREFERDRQQQARSDGREGREDQRRDNGRRDDDQRQTNQRNDNERESVRSGPVRARDLMAERDRIREREREEQAENQRRQQEASVRRQQEQEQQQRQQQQRQTDRARDDARQGEVRSGQLTQQDVEARRRADEIRQRETEARSRQVQERERQTQADRSRADARQRPEEPQQREAQARQTQQQQQQERERQAQAQQQQQRAERQRESEQQAQQARQREVEARQRESEAQQARQREAESRQRESQRQQEESRRQEQARQAQEAENRQRESENRRREAEDRDRQRQQDESDRGNRYRR
jgi:hypothetical protein